MPASTALHTARATLQQDYEAVKRAAGRGYGAADARNSIRQICRSTLQFLAADAERVQLNSRVPGKSYFSYRTDRDIARPANSALFIPDLARFDSYWSSWESRSLSAQQLGQLLYTAALAPCLGMELFDKQNKKGPATFFECFVGNLVSTQLGREPTRTSSFRIANSNIRLTMDFLFAPQDGQPGVHLPVKMSTRERVVQAWSHQRMLDAFYGARQYQGLMVLFSETKLDSRNLEVVEICVPDQWLAYQTLLARMDDIYYFDIPTRYQQLANEHANLLRIEQIENFIR